MLHLRASVVTSLGSRWHGMSGLSFPAWTRTTLPCCSAGQCVALSALRQPSFAASATTGPHRGQTSACNALGASDGVIHMRISRSRRDRAPLSPTAAIAGRGHGPARVRLQGDKVVAALRLQAAALSVNVRTKSDLTPLRSLLPPAPGLGAARKHGKKANVNFTVSKNNRTRSPYATRFGQKAWFAP